MASLSLTCPMCSSELAIALAVATPNPARRYSRPLAPVAPPVAHVVALEVTEAKANTKPKQRKQVVYGAVFEEFWHHFPIHRDKAKAQDAFDAALDAGYDAEEIINGASDYARWLKTATTAPKYAQGWLNDRRWEDELDIPFEVGATDPAFIVGTEEYAARVQAEEDRAIAELTKVPE